jgi:atypical dual specificity phosphatase
MVRNFRWFDEHVAGCAMPLDEKDVSKLSERGIGAIVSLTPDLLNIDPAIAQNGIAHLRELVNDGNPPTKEQTSSILDFIKQQKSRGVKTVIHCIAGVGRTNTTAAIYLIDGGMSLSHALETIKTVETDGQFNAISNFALAKSSRDLKLPDPNIESIRQRTVHELGPNDIIKS